MTKTLTAVAVATLCLLAAPPPAANAVVQAPVRATQATGEIPEAEILDVAVQIFDPGLTSQDPLQLKKDGVYPDLRRAEAMYMAVRLMDTLQGTGNWGAVRVVPRDVDPVEVVVSGTIVRSTGKEMSLEIEAGDASGREWLSKKYKLEANPLAYDAEREVEVRSDPFQSLYNRIANDLLAARLKLKPHQLLALRTVSELRFAADLAPDTFGEYLETSRKGRLEAVQIPAEGDPMMARIGTIRERDYLLVDTLTEHYSDFQSQMAEAYDSWRGVSYEEQLALEELRRKSRKLKLIGILGILGGVVAAREGGGAVGDIAIIGGMAAIQAGIGRSQEAKIHREALQELAASFDAEVDPMLVDVEGQTLRLTGSAETQFTTWREMLRQIFVTESGLPLDPDAVSGTVPAGAQATAADS